MPYQRQLFNKIASKNTQQSSLHIEFAMSTFRNNKMHQLCSPLHSDWKPFVGWQGIMHKYEKSQLNQQWVFYNVREHQCNPYCAPNCISILSTCLEHQCSSYSSSDDQSKRLPILVSVLRFKTMPFCWRKFMSCRLDWCLQLSEQQVPKLEHLGMLLGYWMQACIIVKGSYYLY